MQKENLEQCSLPELQQFADRHPYFGAAQILLAKKMQEEQLDGFDRQLQKTLMYFHNPLWVEQLLNDTGGAEIIKSKKEENNVISGAVLPAENSIAETAPVPSEILPAVIPVTAPVESTETETAPADSMMPAAATEPEASVLPEPVAGKQEEETLLFEPYHTVDYFASQGIRFREEEKPGDKFGQQLKSFTAWLKTLKKVPVSEITKAAEPAAEKNVVEMAERSVAEREILTEAMAEVWEKQGNRARAIEIYGKLSLLEPSKSTYFAAKIEDLKKQI